MKNPQKVKYQHWLKRKKRVRAKVKGTKLRPRLNVFRSLKHIYTQLINDEEGETLVSASSLEVVRPNLRKKKKSKIDLAFEVGKLMAQRAQKKDIKKIVFDKSGYKYHGRVEALANGAREGGLVF